MRGREEKKSPIEKAVCDKSQLDLHEVHTHVHVLIVLKRKAHVDDERMVKRLEDLSLSQDIPDGIHSYHLSLGNILEGINLARAAPLDHADLYCMYSIIRVRED